jgi:hypothetical protein
MMSLLKYVDWEIRRWLDCSERKNLKLDSDNT